MAARLTQAAFLHSHSSSKLSKPRPKPAPGLKRPGVLRTTGLVEVAGSEGDARVRVYRLRAEPFVALRAWLDQVEAFWADQLGAFAEHVNERVNEQVNEQVKEVRGDR